MSTDNFPTFTKDGKLWVSPALAGHELEQGTIYWRTDRNVLHVQLIDAYAYQREFEVGQAREPGDALDKLYWRVAAYKHPFKPGISQRVSRAVAKRIIDRMIELYTLYPSLIFNETGYTEHQPPHLRVRHEGFVHFHDLLLAGAEPSVKLLP